MNEIEELDRDINLKLAELKLENARLKQQLENKSSSSFSQICADFGSECIAAFYNESCVDANNAFLAQLKFAKEAIKSLTYKDLFGCIQDYEEIQYLLKNRKEGRIYASLNGNGVCMFANVSIKYPFAGCFDRFILVANDISECREKELQIQIEHDELDTIFNTSMIGIVYLDMDRIVRRANRRAAEIVGYDTVESVIGVNMREFHLASDQYEAFAENYATILEEGKKLELEYQFRKKDGAVIWVHLIGKAIHQPLSCNEYSGTLWTFEDITERRKAQEDLVRINRELETYFENSIMGIAIVVYDNKHNRTVTRVNTRIVELLGYDYKEEVEGMSAELFHISREQYDRFMDEVISQVLVDGIGNFEYQLKRKDGSYVWVTGAAQAIDANTPPDLSKGVIMMIDDTTEKREDREKLERANAELSAYFNNSMVGVLVDAEDNIISRANRRMANILGYEFSSEIIGMYSYDLLYDQDGIEETIQHYNQLLAAHSMFKYEVKLRNRYGESVWACISGMAIDKSPKPDLSKGVVWVVEDITARKVAEAKLVELATIDELTGLNNRRSFMALCDKELLIARRKKSDVALFMIDLDYFKAVNDTYGHAVGDQTLRYFADVCRKDLRPSDTLGRIGGEEFAILLTDTPKDQVLGIAERLRQGVMEAFEDAPEGIPQMTISIGVCFIEDGEEFSEALKRADKALYAAKDLGRNQVAVEEML